MHLISCLWIPYEKKRAFTPSTKPEGTSKATGATCSKGLCAMTWGTCPHVGACLSTCYSGETVQAHDCSYTGLCFLLLFYASGCVQPIAPEVLVPRLHPHDPARTQ